MLNFHAVRIGPNEGDSELAIDAGGAVIAIPTLANSLKPKYVYLKAYGEDGPDLNEAIMVSPQVSAVIADAATGYPLTSRGQGVILDVQGYSHIGFDLTGGSGAGSVNVIPLADF